MKRFKGTKGVIILFVLIIMLICYYFYLSNRTRKVEERDVVTTKVQDILLEDISRNYPASPKELMKYYSELTKCFYNEEYSEEELSELSARALELYDPELAGAKTPEQYLNDLKYDIQTFKDDKIVISSYKVPNSTDVNYFEKDGHECASLYCTYILRKGTSLQTLEEVFILRRDKDGHWKIFGWDTVDPESKEKEES